jgi:GAF domain-containing protein
MLKEDVPVGAISIYRTEVRPFTEKQIELIASFASQAVIAIENARLLNELRQSLEQQTATAKVLDVISRSAFDLRAVFEAVIESSVRLCGADRAFFYRFDGEVLRVAAGFNAPKELTEYVERTPIRPGRNSASARAALEHRTVHVSDCLADPEYSWGGKDVSPVRTVLAVPILKGDDLLGVIVTYHLEVRPFTEKQIALVETFADQAAIAIENVRLFQAEQQRKRELTESIRETLQQQTATADVLKVISRSTFDLQVVLDTLVESAADLCEADSATIHRQKGEAYGFAASYGFPIEFAQYLKDHPIRPHRGSALGRAVLDSTTTHVADVQADPEYSLTEQQNVGKYRTVLSVPLMREGIPMGVITLTRSAVRPFNEKQIGLATTFADQAVIAIENARLLGDLRQRTGELGRSVEELRALGEVSQAVNSTLDLETVLSTIVAKAV